MLFNLIKKETLQKTELKHYAPTLRFQDIPIPHAIVELSDDIKEKIVIKYLKTYHSLSFATLPIEQEEKKLREENYNAFEIGVLLDFAKHHKKVHATQPERDMFPKYFYTMSMHNIEEHVLTIANKYIQKEYFTLSENKLKQQVDWTPMDAAFLLFFNINY
ncbi:MAG: hypothetical protein PHF17_12035 [Arcobacteraceae bacterium]|nr:hypothetical protein [Arcobacteraceae bacterium]